MSPTQAGEDTQDWEVIVKRYKNNKVGRFQRRKRGVATNWGKELASTQAEEDT